MSGECRASDPGTRSSSEGVGDSPPDEKVDSIRVEKLLGDHGGGGGGFGLRGQSRAAAAASEMTG